ncbi:Glycosyltransferase, catalytic subunit of cellulose synthase and poly-beta-1,6-N-acetylglucosamine synthase [Formosa sp. Hel1_31_208]|uniref:glycosyltransferase n=1 Tax=Formosa sp. Hel1_31_208 TaxID=1798225 RepID=UPI00087D3764|nr:Glycosyltransferase, catalytic subunit of cellulose synthase and poly-beta-1,6-N-acetylglucosamine synthase [Formosa sp. Hel1_31_208]
MEVLFYVFVIFVVIQLVYYGIIFGSLAAYEPREASPKKIGVSVIICAKNEAENLKVNLPYILAQDYPTFELILINDHSSDETLELMKSFKNDNHRIKIVDVKPIEKFWGNKKYALTLGIKAATYDFLLFTDADCKPTSNRWISRMSNQFTNEKDLIIGYSPYKKTKGSLLNILIRFETFMTAVQYLSYARIGHTYMAVGRNLAYKKDLFYEARGFMNHMDIRSGDDDLFVNQVATKKNTALCISKDSFTTSLPKTTLKAWILQKRRHISTAKHYKPIHQIMLALFYVSQIGFWILGITLLILMFQWEMVVALIILRFGVQYTSLYLSSKKLEETSVITFLPILEFLLITFQFFIFIKNISSKPQHWK